MACSPCELALAARAALERSDAACGGLVTAAAGDEGDSARAGRAVVAAAREGATPAAGAGPDWAQIELWIRAPERRFWSPQLKVLARPMGGLGDGGEADRDLGAVRDGARSVVRGHFGPNGHVWTMFTAIQAIIALAGIFAAFVGLAELTLGRTPWWLLSVPIGIAGVGLVYVAAGIGQRLGHAQTEVLERFLDEACASAEARRAAQTPPAGVDGAPRG